MVSIHEFLNFKAQIIQIQEHPSYHQQTQNQHNIMTFLEFLKSLKPRINQSPLRPTRFILGNSSADYDSLFGSLIYAFILTSLNQHDYIPLIDCLKHDIPLRFQTLYVMKQFKIDYNDLIYTEDMPEGFMSNPQNKFYLYDHNQRKGLKKIEQIVDHHTFIERESSPPCENRVIFPTGSCMTLLYFMMHPKLLSKEAKDEKMKQLEFKLESYFKANIDENASSANIFDKNPDQTVEQLIKYGVEIDCFGFDMRQKQRWTEADEILRDNIPLRSEYGLSYEKLSSLKFEEGLNLELSIDEHIRRDYKEFEYNKIGKVQYAVVCLDPDVFLKAYDKELLSGEHFKEKRNYEVFMFMFIWIERQEEGGETIFGREAIFSIGKGVNEEREKQIIGEIEAIFKKLKMEKKESAGMWLRWKDPSSTISRKKVDKVFKELL